MGVIDWINKLVQIPGRLTSIAIEHVVCGADEVYDDTLQKRQSELNARFKAVTDQEQIAIDGGTATIAGGPEDIVVGSGAIPTANAVAQVLSAMQTDISSTFVKGVMSVRSISENTTVSEVTVDEGSQKNILYVNSGSEEITLTVLNANFRTPDGDNIILTIPAGGYGEVNYLRLGNVIYARGC